MFTFIENKLRAAKVCLVLNGNVNDEFIMPGARHETGSLVLAMDAFFAARNWPVVRVNADFRTGSSASAPGGRTAPPASSAGASTAVADTPSILGALTSALESAQVNTILIVSELEQLFLSDESTQQLQQLRRIINLTRNKQAHLLLVSQVEVPRFIGELPEVDSFSIPKPDIHQRQQLFAVHYGDADARALAKWTEGLHLKQCSSLIYAAGQHSHPDFQTLIREQRLGLSQTTPWDSFDEEDYRQLDENIKRNVIGQDAVVSRVLKVVKSCKTNLNIRARNKPRGVFFFCGTTGVGKTELAKLMGEAIFTGSAVKKFDMSEYKEAHKASTLLGAPHGYVGSEEGGVLTNFVRDSPFSVLIFDEIEKAHPDVFKIFLQIIDDGQLTSSAGQTVYFNETMIVFTSNLGVDKVSISDPYDVAVEKVKAGVERAFEDMQSPELYGRLKRYISVFDVLRDDHIPAILTKFLDRLVAELAKHQVTLEVDDSAIAHLRAGIDCRYGARDVMSHVENLQEDIGAIMFDHPTAAGFRVTAENNSLLVLPVSFAR